MSVPRGGARGGRPTKVEQAKRAVAADPLQRKLIVAKHVTLNVTGPVTTFNNLVNNVAVGNASGESVNVAAAQLGQKRPREDDDAEDKDDAEDEFDGAENEFDGLEDSSSDEGSDGQEQIANPPGDKSVSKTARTTLARDGNAESGVEKSVGLGARKGKKRRYTKEERMHVTALLAKLNNNLSAAVREVQAAASGFKELTRQTVARWARSPPTPKTFGRKVEVDFEKDVLGNLMFLVLQTVNDDEQKLVVVANSAYTYETIRSAALQAQMAPKWQVHPTVSKLKFTDPWVQAFLQRNTLRRRRVTTTDKAVPPPAEVAARMQAIQKTIEDGGFEPCDVINADETGIFFGAKPKNQYVPKDAERASAPDSNDKARFTAVMWGTADGNMGPPFIIVKNAVAGFDQTSSTCLDAKHLMKEAGFRAGDGWEHKMWSKEMEFTIKGKLVKGTYKRNYIIHNLSGAVITANKTAWMDSVTMVMWAELQLGPWRAASGRRKLLVMDNCGPHGVLAVQEAFAAQDIAVEHLPPNLTGQLQVMDLVVNGPLKAAIRRERCKALHTNFLAWKAEWAMELVKLAADRRMPSFRSPKPSIADGLRTLFATCSGDFQAEGFKKGLQRSFVNVGLSRDTSLTPAFFHKFQSQGRKGTIPKELANADTPDDSVFVLGDVAAEVEMEARPDGLSDVEDDGEDNTEDEMESSLPFLLGAAATTAAASTAATTTTTTTTSAAVHAPAPPPAAAAANLPRPASTLAPPAASAAVTTNDDNSCVHVAGTMVAPAANVSEIAGATRPTFTTVVRLRAEGEAQMIWRDYLDAAAKGSKTIMARRLDKLRTTVTSIAAQYKELGEHDKAEHTARLLAGAEAAIADGTPTSFPFVF